MAQQVTADAFLLGIYKSWYSEEEFANLMFRNSPAAKKVKKNRVGGRDVKFGMAWGGGGNVSGDYTIAVANAASSSKNSEMIVTPGNIHAVFNVTQKEILAAQTKRGGYVSGLVNKMFTSTDMMRKIFAACFYGFGAGDIGALPAIVAIGAATMTLNYDTIVKMAVGTQFFVVNGATPLAAFYDAVVRTVTAIDGTTVTFDVVVGAVAWAAGSLIEIRGGRDATPLYNMPCGLASWIPSVANRTGAVWTVYIATAFYGVNRSLATSALAGWFYQRQPGEAKADAISQGMKLARRGGGVPTGIVVNDDDWQDIVYELNAQTNFYQAVNQAGAKDQNAITRGVAKLKYSFSTSYIDLVYEDPYCPKGTAYILDWDVIEFAALSNVESPINDGVAENEPGAPKVAGAAEPDLTSKLLIDDYISVASNSTSVEGPASQVSLSLYGNFIVHAPGHCAVIVF